MQWNSWILHCLIKAVVPLGSGAHLSRSSSAVTGIPASRPQKILREEAQPAHCPRITADNAIFPLCTKYRIGDSVAGWLEQMEN
jgi:hypothetical protein